MPTTYEQLVNVGGTIYTKAGKGYATPTELATDLGILPHQIDWTKIVSSTTIPTTTPAVAPVVAPVPAPVVTAEKPLGGLGQGIISPVQPDTGYDGFLGYVNGRIQVFPTQQAAQQAGATGIEPNYKRYPASTVAPVPAPAPAPAPKPAAKTTAPAATIIPTEKPYVRNPNGLDVYDRAGNYISAEKAAQIPGFWDLVEISSTAPDTSKGAGLGGPVTGKNDGLGYVTYNGIDVYEKATGRYIDFDTAKRLNIWNQIETSVDPKVLEDLGIDPNGETPTFKDEDLAEEYKATESPYQLIYNDFKKSMDEANTKLENAWLDYNNAVIEIEENPWLLTGEVTQELNKLKRKSLAKIDALTKAKSNMLEEFNMAIGLTEKTVEWEKGLEPETTVVEVGGRKLLINSKTGKTIQDLGETTANTQVIEVNGRKLLVNSDTGETIQDLGAAEVAEQWSEPYMLGGDYVQKNTKTGEIRTAVNVASGSQPPTAPSTLKDLAKLGITRKHSTGLGWDFFYNNEPVTAKEISEATGISMATLLEGSDNPKDIDIIRSTKVYESSSGATNEELTD